MEFAPVLPTAVPAQVATLRAAGWKRCADGSWMHPDVPLVDGDAKRYTYAEALQIEDFPTCPDCGAYECSRHR